MSKLLAVMLLVFSLPLGGCVEIVALGVSAVVGGASVYQRYEDRGVQAKQNEEIRALREEIAKTRKVLEGKQP